MKRNLPVYAVQLDDTEDTGILAMSFVSAPATERAFIALSKAQPVKLHYNKSKQILSGVVLIPEQLIYRDATSPTGECYIKYSAQDIERIAVRMMQSGIALSSTTHQHEKPLAGNFLVECWTVADPKRDKAVAIGLGELPKGTLCASYKIQDRNYWLNEVLTGNVRGFSLEGLFNFNTIHMSTTKKPAAKTAARKPNKMAVLLRSMALFLEGDTVAETDDLADVAADDTTDSGTPFLAFDLAENGGTVEVDSDGYATLDGEQMPAGEHALADGNVLVIDADGNMVETADEAVAEEAAVAEAALAEAKKRGKTILAAMKKSKDPKDVKIAKLQAELAAAKRTPSTKKAVQTTLSAKDPSKMTKFEKMAEAHKARMDRQG